MDKPQRATDSCPGAMHRGAEPLPRAPDAPPPRRKRRRSPAGFLLFLLLLAGATALVWVIPKAGRGGAGNGLGPSFELDVDAFAAIDPALIVCTEAAPLALALAAPRGVAVGPDGRIYVCGDDGVQVLNADGSPAASFAPGAPAQCIAVGPDGSIYLGLGDHVEVFDAAGARQAEWNPPAQGALVSAVAVLGERVFVTDAANSRLTICDLSGRPLFEQGGFVLFSSPDFDAAAEPGGAAVWVVNPGARELRRYGDGGEVLASWTRVSRRIDGFSGCCNPMHVAVRPDGTLVTSEKNIVRVKLLGPDGSLRGVVAGPDMFAKGIKSLDLAVDAANRILVLDPERRAVRVFVDRQG